MEKRLFLALMLVSTSLILNGAGKFVNNKLCKSIDGMVYKGLESEKLYAAAKNNNLEKVREVLEEGRAMIDTRGSFKLDNTPLMEAAKNGNPQMAKDLINAGADVTLKNAKGQTAVDIAKQSNSAKNVKDKIVKLLKSYGGKEG